MKSHIRLILISCVSSSLLPIPRLLLAGPPVAEGKVRVLLDLPESYLATGWISIAGQPPSPVGLAGTSSVVTITGAQANWNFSTVTLNTTVGLDEKAAKGVSLKLGDANKHHVDPHTKAPAPNELPSIETPTKDVELGKTNRYWAWASDTHRDSQGRHTDYYMVGGDVSYREGGVNRELVAEYAYVDAEHNRLPLTYPEEPRGVEEVGVESNLLFDAERGILSIRSSNVHDGVDTVDPLSQAWIQDLNFYLDGQDDSGAWLFRDGYFSLSTPSGDIAIEGALNELALHPSGGFGFLSRGGAVDASQGASPWMNQLSAAFQGHVDTGIEGTTYGAPALWLNPGLDLAQLTNGFTKSSGLIPLQMTFGLTLAALEKHDRAGDYNGDGHIDSQDYDVWKASYGMTTSRADGNGDGIVDAADYVVWRDSLETGLTTFRTGQLANQAEAIPEPSPAVLMMIALCLAVPAYRIPQIQRLRTRERGCAGNSTGDGIVCPLRRREAEAYLTQRTTCTDRTHRPQ
jgi:hypothetical protein